MKQLGFCRVGIALMVTSPLLADSTSEAVKLEKAEKKLERMQADRTADMQHAHQAQKEFNKGAAELSGHDEQLSQDVEHLKSAESQVEAGEKEKAFAHESYKKTVEKYGSDDPRSAAAKENVKQNKKAMRPILENRRALKADVEEGRRQVHNDKTVLGVQKRDLTSDARYRASEDRKIEKQEKHIAEDRKSLDPKSR